MALVQCSFFSESLGLSSSMTVIIPQAPKSQAGISGRKGARKYPVLYLLHGMSDDHTSWSRQTSIERYVAVMGLAVVMPAVNRSYYSDMHSGPKYWTFLSQELPELVESFFPVSDRREDTFAAGLSMGGYGAFKLALTRPEKFAAAASLSGALDPQALAGLIPERNHEHVGNFGEKSVYGTSNDLYHISQELAKSSSVKPRLFQCCGTEDFLYRDNLKFKEHLEKLNFDLTYEDGPGDHEWGYWDVSIRKTLSWLNLQ
ncbi:MAG: alpha/beta hydrolase family protein [bacterium]